MDEFKKKILIAIISVLVLGVVGYGIYYGSSKRSAPAPQQAPQNAKPSVFKMAEEKKRTEEILKTDPTDPVHVANLKYIQGALERYYNDRRQYPEALTELVPIYVKVLPKYSSRRDYFYANSPAEKPQSYHLGTLLGGRNTASPEAFKTDSDFDSAKAGWAGGFNGLDPVYDLTNNKK